MNKTQKELESMEYVQYGNTGTHAYFDGDCYYNDVGQWLNDPGVYDTNSEGYTPFGDE